MGCLMPYFIFFVLCFLFGRVGGVSIVFSSAALVDDVHFFRNEELLRLNSFTSSVEKPHEAVIDISTDIYFDTMVVLMHNPLELQSLLAEEVPTVMHIYIYENEDSDAEKTPEKRSLLWWTSFSITSDEPVKSFSFQQEDLRQVRSHPTLWTAQTPASPSPKFSSFHCIHGSQTFPAWEDTILQQYDFSEESSRRDRICVYKDVCFIQNQFVFFENDNEIVLDNMKYSNISPLHHLHSQTYHFSKHLDPTLAVMHHSIPESLPYVSKDDRVYFFQQQSQTYNFAHCLLEDLMPIFKTMDIFNLGAYDEATVIHDCDCGRPVQSEEVIAACKKNMKTYSSLLDIDMIDALSLPGQSVCFPTIVMGQSMVCIRSTMRMVYI